MQVKYLQQYQIYCVKVKATYILMIIRKVLTGPSKAHYLGAQTQDSHKESFHFWVIVIICFPLFHLLSWLSSDQFREVAFIIFFSFLFFCRKKKKNPRGQNSFSCFLHYRIKKNIALVCMNTSVVHLGCRRDRIWTCEKTKGIRFCAVLLKYSIWFYPKGDFP